MKKIILITVFICSLVASLSANSLYIKAITVPDRGSLFGVQYDLDELGYKMYITESNNQYIAYVGPFENKGEANIALDRIKKNISRDAYVLLLDIYNGNVVPSKLSPNKIAPKVVVQKAIIVPSKQEPIIIQKAEVLYSNNEDIKEKVDSPQIEEPILISNVSEEEIIEPVSDKKISEPKITHDYFVGLTLGLSTLDVSGKNVSGSLPLSFDDAGINYGLEAGYYINENIFMTINFHHLDLDYININNVFSAVNYKFDKMYSVFPYVGLIAGYSILSWEGNPATVTSTESSSSLFGGLQFGAEIPINDDVVVNVFYRYMMLNHTASVSTSSAKKNIEYSGDHNFNIGIMYSF